MSNLPMRRSAIEKLYSPGKMWYEAAGATRHRVHIRVDNQKMKTLGIDIDMFCLIAYIDVIMTS